MRLTYKYRIYPTKSQIHILNDTLELCRWTYNEIIAFRKNAYEESKENVSLFQTINLLPQWKNDKPELKTVYSQILQNVMVRANFAFKAFFRRVKSGEKPGYPRFKSKGQYNSFTYPSYDKGVTLDYNGLTLYKVGHVKIKLHRSIEGKIKTVTICRAKTNKWYVCFSCEVESKLLALTNEIIGIDLGLSKFATLSNKIIIKRRRWMKIDTKDIVRLQRKMDICPKGSSNKLNIRIALNHAHQRVTNRRNNFIHYNSRKLINAYQLMIFEDLNIQEMLSDNKRTLHRNINDVAWKQFIQYCMYKAESAGRTMLFVDPKNTTQQCSGCGKIVKKDISVRIHDCPHCGLKIDRDLNAARNILARGLASIPSDRIKALDLGLRE